MIIFCIAFSILTSLQEQIPNDIREAAERGNAQAQFELADWYYENDNERAVYWLRKAAEQEHAEAQYSLGFFYEQGIGVDKNETKALYWWRKAAEQEHPEAQFDLGLSYMITQDYAQAIHWMRKAAEQRYAEAQYFLGLFYSHGAGIDVNYDMALYWYELAIANGLSGDSKTNAENDIKHLTEQGYCSCRIRL